MVRPGGQRSHCADVGAVEWIGRYETGNIETACSDVNSSLFAVLTIPPPAARTTSLGVPAARLVALRRLWDPSQERRHLHAGHDNAIDVVAIRYRRTAPPWRCGNTRPSSTGQPDRKRTPGGFVHAGERPSPPCRMTPDSCISRHRSFLSRRPRRPPAKKNPTPRRAPLAEGVDSTLLDDARLAPPRRQRRPVLPPAGKWVGGGRSGSIP